MGLLNRKYLDKEDKAELKSRQEQIHRQRLICDALEIVKRNWMMIKFSKYGLDASKQWTFNPMTGQINEVKPPKKK